MVPGTLRPIAHVLSELELDLGANVSVSPSSARAALLELQVADDYWLHFQNNVEIDGGFSIDVINFIYVDRNCTVTIKAESGNFDEDGVTFIMSMPAATLELKSGWNMVSGKVSTEMDLSIPTVTITIEFSVVSTLPSDGKWVLDEVESEYW